MENRWYKENESDKIWWYFGDELIEKSIFSFDKKKKYRLLIDYPFGLTKEELEIFNKENPLWVKLYNELNK